MYTYVPYRTNAGVHMDGTTAATPTAVPFIKRYNDTATLEQCGLTWLVESTSKRKNKNDSQKYVNCTDAQILHIVDAKLFCDNFPNGYETQRGIGNTTSLRVHSQHVNRHNADKTVDERRQMIWEWLCGVRSATVTVQRVTETVTVHTNPLPTGMYTGTDENEYRAAYTVGLVDMGLDATRAREIALRVPFNGIVPTVATVTSDEPDDDDEEIA